MVATSKQRDLLTTDRLYATDVHVLLLQHLEVDTLALHRLMERQLPHGVTTATWISTLPNVGAHDV